MLEEAKTKKTGIHQSHLIGSSTNSVGGSNLILN